MIRTHLKTLILTSVLILLPIPLGLLLWDTFPADRIPSQFMTVYLPPLSMLAAQWLCVLITALDPGNRGRNKKVQNLVLWIMPLITWFCSVLMYALYLGFEISTSFWMILLFGILFAAIGNYLPKTRMNSTIGIKVSWAYTSEENWNATHRFAGKLWVVGGLLLIPAAFLPEGAAIPLMIMDILVLCAVPTIYSWRFWKQQKAEGAALKPIPKLFGGSGKLVALLLCLLVLFLLLVLFSGNLHPVYSDTGFTIEASFYDDLTVAYDDIDSIEYRDGNVPGSRIFGFGSLRLLLGTFENEEFGIYTRYTYYKPEACIVLTCGENTLVLSGRDAGETKAICKYLQSKIA